MNEEIPVLVDLSRADLDCSRLHARTEAIPRELEKHEAELVLHRNALELEEGKLEDLRRDRRMLEHDADGARQRRRELELQQFRIKNNVEYQAMVREIADLNRRADELEGQALKVIDEEKLAQAEIDRLRELIAQEERRLAGIRERLQAELASFQAELAAARAARDGLVARLSPQLRGRYERIRRSKGDMAVVGVEGGACGGCGYQLPPQRLLELQRRERVIVCEGCGRILVWTR